MRHFIKFAVIAFVIMSIQSCFTQKQITNTLINIFGIDKICFSEPLNYSFDPNKPDAIKVQISLSNTNNYDVTGSLSIEIIIRDENNHIIGGTYPNFIIPPTTVFPQNLAKAYTSPFIDVATSIPLKTGEKYIIEARKFVIGATYSASNNPFNSSCNLYSYPITLK